MKLIAIFFLTLSSLLCQTIEAIPWGSGPDLASVGLLKDAAGQSPRQSSFGTADSVFPHLATGGGWETIIVTVNLSTTSMSYRTYFFDQSGKPMTVTIRASTGELISTPSTISTLPRSASLTVPLIDDNASSTRTGWAVVVVDAATSESNRLGGYATFRQRIEGRPDFEALVPMSSSSDYRFYLPVDETMGFQTAVALCNPSTTLSTTLTLLVLDTNGRTNGRQTTLTLGPLEQTAFLIRDKFPTTVDQRWTLYVSGTTNGLSALGLRFNTLGGSAFSSIPVMNWSGMFQ